MNKIYNNALELIGNTPLVRLEKIEKRFDLKATLLAKVEMFNPAGSVKDRIALSMIENAEQQGLLVKGGTIIEATSGNTGIGLALVAAVKGYNVIITLPDTMSIERRNLLKAYGATLVLTDGSLGMKGAILKAEAMHANTPNSILASQFENMANPQAHVNTTGVEIYEDSEGSVDIFVAGVGTGGTISGVGQYLKSKKDVKVIAVEPKDSSVLSGGKAGPHKIQGIGAGFIPNTLNTNIYDEIIRIGNEEAFEMGRIMARSEGLLVGISSGAALHAAIEEAKKEENEGKTIVVLMADTGERYLSTPMFSE